MAHPSSHESGGAELIKTLNAMREWLDHRRCETCSFRQIFIAGRLALQIGFLNLPDATTFADQFDGQLMQAHQVVIAI